MYAALPRWRAVNGIRMSTTPHVPSEESCDRAKPQPTESELEREWQIARDAAEKIRAEVIAERDSLGAYDVRLAAARQRRDASQLSLLLTRQAAERRGALSSPMTRHSVNRFEEEIEQARDDARRLVEDAAPLCIAFYAACEQLHVARKRERNALERFMAMRELRDPLLQEEQQLTEHLKAEAERLARAHAHEEELRREEEWSYGVYDPKYDPWELWERRNRPWV